MRAGCRNSREGFVLVTVLFIVTLLLSAAAAFTWFARQEVKRVAREEYALRARSLASVAAATVSGWIAGDTNDYDSLRELLYSPSIPKILNYGKWSVLIKITPQNYLIPINGLFLPDGVTLRKEYEYAWKEIWELLDKRELSDLVLDFLDRDTIAKAGSREEDFFPNRPISDLSELLRLPEIDVKTLYGDKNSPIALDKFFTVYGENAINVNLTPKILLSILDQELDSDKAESLALYRQNANLKSFADLLKSPGFPKGVRARLENVIGYKSTFFQVELKILDGEGQERNFTAIMKRAGSEQCEVVSWRE